jgi:hypothetical protein
MRKNKTFLSKIIFSIFFIFLVSIVYSYVDLAKDYENKADRSYKLAKDYVLKNDYINSLAKYVEAITFYTLSYHIYIDKLKDKDNFFRVSDKTLKVSLESDNIAYKAVDQVKDENKKNNILFIRSSNYVNFASTLEKMYSVDYNIADKKYNELKKIIKTEDSILISIAKYFGKSIDIQLSLGNKSKAQEYFSFLDQYYKTLDNRIRDKYEIKKIVDFYSKKLKGI